MSTRASGPAILGVKRRTPDFRPLRCAPDTVRIASGERGGQLTPPSWTSMGEGREFFSGLHVCIFLWKGCVTERKYTCPVKQQVPSSTVFQTLSEFANLQRHHISQTSVRKPRSKAPRTGMQSAIRYALLPRQPGFTSFPAADFRPLLLRTRPKPPSLPGVLSGSVSHGVWPAGRSVVGGVAEQTR